MIMISNVIFNFTNFCVTVSFFIKLLISAVRAVTVPKLVILGISPLTSFILALRATVLAKLAMVGISHLTSYILALRVVLVAKLVIN